MTREKTWSSTNRLGGLRRFASAITIFTILGHAVFGFEQSVLQPIIAVLAAYVTEMLLELIDAWASRRRPRFLGSPVTVVDFLLSAHITGLAIAMLLYANDRLWPVAFAAVVAIASKSVLRAAIAGRSRHFFNPSNFGITLTLLLFPWVGIAQPYHFTENLSGIGNWILPGLIVVSGSFLNARYTKRIPLLLAFVIGFALQALVRSLVFGTPVIAPWLPMTGVAFVLYTFYMVTDPATTPSGTKGQITFGAAVAACYGMLLVSHVVFGLFFALSIVCALRGLGLWVLAAAPALASAPAPSAPTAPRSPTADPAPPRPSPAATEASGAGPDLAIVGMACRYPDARSPGELWENVLTQRRAFRRIPAERLRAEDYYSADRSVPDRTYAVNAALIEGYEFDRVAYRVAGATFRAADLAHWLGLDVAAEALRDAGFPDGEGLPRHTTGVHLGNTLTGEFSRANVMRLRWPYVRRVVAQKLADEGWVPDRRAAFLAELETLYKSPFPEVGNESLAGGLSNTIAGRICNHFDLKGGGYTVDGACAASLLAVITSCNALANGDLDVALAGGVDLSLDPFELVGFAKTGALAPDEMRVYDERSSGFWPGEGCGFVVLMRQEDAIARGLRIYATIRGWGVSSDGSGGITRPDVEGQLLALSRAYDRAGFGIDTVEYFEGHGTGTRVGDATEIEVLSQARRAAGAPGADAPAAVLGSIKANIGHTKAAAGIAGLIKSTMALRAGILPPTTGCENPDTKLLGPSRALRVLSAGERWPHDRPRRAAVSAMGFGGINTHLVLDAADQPCPQGVSVQPPHWWTGQDAELFLLRAKDAWALREQAERLCGFAGRLAQCELGDLAAELARTLDGGPVRAAIVASSPRQLEKQLETLVSWLEAGCADRVEPAAGVFLGTGTSAPRIGFLFSGQGAPAHRHGGALARRFPEARARYDRLDLPADHDDVSTLVAQPAIVSASMAALRVLERLGIDATVAIGHSLGELTAMHWGGAMDEEALLDLATARGRAMSELGRADGAMASVAAPAEAVASLFAGDDAIVIAAYNTPERTVISGPLANVDAAMARAEQAGIRATRLPVSHAFHSALVADAVAPLREHLDRATPGPLERAVASTITGDLLARDADLAGLLCDQVVSPVRFTQALKHVSAGADLLIEVGPGHVLAGLAREHTFAPPSIAIDAGGPSLGGLLAAAGAAWALGAPLRHAALFDERFTRPFSLDWQPRFFENPCERAPVTDDDASPIAAPPDISADDTAADPPDPPAAPKPAELAPAELLRQLVADHAELPRDTVRDDDRFLSDLHLNSLTVGQLVVEATQRLGIAPPAAPTDFADATIAEVVATFDTAARLDPGTATPGAPPPGVDTWVRAFEVAWVDRPLPVADAERGDGGVWQVVASPDRTDEAAAIKRALAAECPDGGVVVCLSSGASIDRLVAGADAVRATGATRLVIVQHGGGSAAFAKTLHLEYPQVATLVIDVPSDDPRAPAWIASEAAALAGFAEVRYDHTGRRAQPVLRPIADDEGGALPVGADDVVLVTGGGKGIAAECALALARATGAALLLLGRSDPADDEALTANLARLSGAGVRFEYARADVTDAPGVARAIETGQDALGPVTVFIHGAGRNEPTPLAELRPEDFHRTIAPKVDGAANVLAAIDPRRLRLLVTFGSIIARTGLPGEADYGVANERLAQLADTWRDEHPHCRGLHLEWSIWSEVGMGHRLGSVDRLKHRGITAITPDTGIAMLLALLRRPAPFLTAVVTGRFGEPPTVEIEPAERPLLRYLQHVRVDYPSIELIADSVLTVDTDPYLADHVFAGRRLLPAVLGLEAMSQVATALGATDHPPVFEAIEFLRPIAVPESGTTTIRVAALRRSPGVVDVVVRSDETDFQIDHFRAVCRLDAAVSAPDDTKNVAPADTVLDLAPADDLYGGILFHAGRFRRLQSYRSLRATACEAEIAPNGSADWFGQYLSPRLILGDPAARDAMIHAVQACIPHRALLPIGVDRIEPIARPRPDAVFVRARERSHHNGVFVYDVESVDRDGAPCERWTGLRLRAVERTDHPRPWAVPLVGPYVERRLQELYPAVPIAVGVTRTAAPCPIRRSDCAVRAALGDDVRVERRPDGKPELVGQDKGVSIAHVADVTFAVAGPARIACDAEAAASRSWAVWEDLLGEERARLARRVADEANEDLDIAATRLWAATECLKKAGALPDTPLTLAAVEDDGWVVLGAGRHASIATGSERVQGFDAPVVLGVLVPAADDPAPVPAV